MKMLRSILSISVLGVALILATAGNASAAEDSSVPVPSPSKAFKGDKCVEPVDTMRREHMNYLQHQRDDTLREGIRGAKYSLVGCVDCHATKSPDVAGGNVRTVKPFCAECHQYAAVKIDCFECHTGIPGNKKVKRMIHPSLPVSHGKSTEEKNALLVGQLDSYLNSDNSDNLGGEK